MYSIRVQSSLCIQMTNASNNHLCVCGTAYLLFNIMGVRVQDVYTTWSVGGGVSVSIDVVVVVVRFLCDIHLVAGTGE